MKHRTASFLRDPYKEAMAEAERILAEASKTGSIQMTAIMKSAASRGGLAELDAQGWLQYGETASDGQVSVTVVRDKEARQELVQARRAAEQAEIASFKSKLAGKA